jgi:hypothetical protein
MTGESVNRISSYQRTLTSILKVVCRSAFTLSLFPAIHCKPYSNFLSLSRHILSSSMLPKCLVHVVHLLSLVLWPSMLMKVWSHSSPYSYILANVIHYRFYPLPHKFRSHRILYYECFYLLSAFQIQILVPRSAVCPSAWMVWATRFRQPTVAVL